MPYLQTHAEVRTPTCKPRGRKMRFFPTYRLVSQKERKSAVRVASENTHVHVQNERKSTGTIHPLPPASRITGPRLRTEGEGERARTAREGLFAYML